MELIMGTSGCTGKERRGGGGVEEKSKNSWCLLLLDQGSLVRSFPCSSVRSFFFIVRSLRMSYTYTAISSCFRSLFRFVFLHVFRLVISSSVNFHIWQWKFEPTESRGRVHHNKKIDWVLIQGHAVSIYNKKEKKILLHLSKALKISRNGVRDFKLGNVLL